MSHRNPAYDLPQVQALVAQKKYRLSKAAANGAGELYLDEEDILECVIKLQPADFYKSMESNRFPGTYQDVYKPRFNGFAIYLKLQIMDGRKVAIISFKRDESA
jgi:hypothetical protein